MIPYQYGRRIISESIFNIYCNTIFNFERFWTMLLIGWFVPSSTVFITHCVNHWTILIYKLLTSRSKAMPGGNVGVLLLSTFMAFAVVSDSKILIKLVLHTVMHYGIAFWKGNGFLNNISACTIGYLWSLCIRGAHHNKQWHQLKSESDYKLKNLITKDLS